MTVNDVANWRVEDPAPSMALADVVPVSRRARSLLARNKGKAFLSDGYLNVDGAISMIEGLEYHHDKFMEIIGGLCADEKAPKAGLRHEGVAYLNRIGQFHYFATSTFVQTNAGDVTLLMPTIERLLILRHKISAHRSLDKPRREDTEHLRTVHELALAGHLFSPKPDTAGEPPVHTPWPTHYLVFQINMGTPDVYELSIERDHTQIALEAYAVLEKLLV